MYMFQFKQKLQFQSVICKNGFYKKRINILIRFLLSQIVSECQFIVNVVKCLRWTMTGESF